MKVSPTQNSLKFMREDGYTCQVVEKWNPHAKVRQDLFGFIDIVCLGSGVTIVVQTTTVKNMSARRKKILASKYYKVVKEAGWMIVIHGWEKVGNRWSVRTERL